MRPLVLAREHFVRHRVRYGIGFLLLGATNVLALSIPRLLKHAIEALQGRDRHTVVFFSLAIVVVAIVQAVVRTFSRLSILGASRHAAFELRDRLFKHLQRLPLDFYAQRPIGDITSRAINDMQLVRSFFGFGVMNLVNTTLVYVTAVSMMFVIDARLTIYALAPYPLFILAVNRLGRRIYGRTMDVQDQMSSLTAKAQETISGINLIKTYARESSESERWADLSSGYFSRTMALAKARGAMIPLMGAMGSFGTLVVVGLGGRAVIQGRITLGDFVAFSAYLAYLAWPTMAFGWILNTFQRGVAALRRVAEILSEPTEDRTLPTQWRDRRLEGSVSFRGLSYTHTGSSAKPQISGVHLEIPKGGTLGILGTVGSGKSTLVGFLPRMLTPPEGAVLVDGMDVNEIPLARLREDIAVVPQESLLFSRTLRENISMGRKSANDEEIDAAVLASGLSRDLHRFPAGLETRVGERGVTLSGGQRQRAALARALAADPRILILDDSLSSLDAEVERDVVAALRRDGRNRTTIIISNRVAALSWSDEIIVMDDGRILERGTHDALLRADGLYSKIARRQSLTDRLEEI